MNDVWAGLGYYRRARLLLEGAQHVQVNLSGKIPGTTAELQKIPGAAFMWLSLSRSASLGALCILQVSEQLQHDQCSCTAASPSLHPHASIM